MSSFLNKHQRLASWGVLGVLLFILAVLVWGPIQGQYDRYRFELSRDARTIQRLQALLASRDELQVASALFEEQGLGDWVFPPDMSDTAIELAIQKNVSDSLSKAGAEVQSIAPVNSRNNEGYKAIGVRVQFSGGLDAIMSGLQALEQSRPLLVLDDLLLSPGPVLARGQTTVPPQIVEAQLSVLTFLPLSVREAGQ